MGRISWIFFNGFPFSVGCYSCRTRGGRDDWNHGEPWVCGSKCWSDRWQHGSAKAACELIYLIWNVIDFQNTVPWGMLSWVYHSMFLFYQRGPRYFDPPDSSWGACYNCGEEGHAAVNCTAAKRKKPCYVCGGLGHAAKQCTKVCLFACWLMIV
jgi:hypothetical protein